MALKKLRVDPRDQVKRAIEIVEAYRLGLEHGKNDEDYMSITDFTPENILYSPALHQAYKMGRKDRKGAKRG